jgi:hypothetical protein
MTTWYVRPVNGSDANDGESFATAWQTTQHAIDSITADTGNEEVYLVSEGVEETSTGIYGLADVTPRSYALRMYAVGPSGETGDLLDYTYTIRVTGGSPNQVLGISGGSDSNAYGDDYRFYGVVFDANNLATYCYYNVKNAGTNFNFYGCRFTNATSSGVRQGGYNSTTYVSCEYDNNGGWGFLANGSNRGNSIHRNCSFHDNVSGGVLGGNSVSLDSCLIYNNTGYGCQGKSRYTSTFHIQHCLIYNNGDDGIEMENLSGSYNASNLIRNNIIYGNGGWGIQSNFVSWTGAVVYNNFISQNTSGAFDLDVSLEDWHRNYVVDELDFDIETGKLNYSSPYENAQHPFGGAPGGAAREDLVPDVISAATADFDSSLTLNSTITFEGSGKRWRLASKPKNGIPVFRRA